MKFKRTKAAKIAAVRANLIVARLVVAARQKAATADKNTFGVRAAASEGVRVVAELAALILLTRLEGDVKRRDAKFVFAEMASIGQLLLNLAIFVLDGDQRRHAVRENGRKNRQIRICVAVCLGYISEK